VIDAFKVGARILVTTRDESVLNVLPNHDKILIEMPSGFSEAESLEVSRKSLPMSHDFK